MDVQGSKKDMRKMSIWPQLFAAFVGSLIFFNHATLTGYATEVLPQLRNESNPNVNLDEYEGSMFASIFLIIGIIVSPLGGITSGPYMSSKTSLYRVGTKE